jgi:hypothetical protein
MGGISSGRTSCARSGRPRRPSSLLLLLLSRRTHSASRLLIMLGLPLVAFVDRGQAAIDTDATQSIFRQFDGSSATTAPADTKSDPAADCSVRRCRFSLPACGGKLVARTRKGKARRSGGSNDIPVALRWAPQPSHGCSLVEPVCFSLLSPCLVIRTLAGSGIRKCRTKA